jgi:transposase
MYETKRKKMGYPSDISREEFEKIRPLLEGARKRTKPRKLDLFDLFNGLLYVVRTGCQWRALPKDYPKWRSVHQYFLIWSEQPEDGEASVLEKSLKKISRKRAYERWQEALNKYGYC